MILWYPVFLVCIAGDCKVTMPTLIEQYYDNRESCLEYIIENLETFDAYFKGYLIEEFLVLSDCIPKENSAKL